MQSTLSIRTLSRSLTSLPRPHRLPVLRPSTARQARPASAPAPLARGVRANSTNSTDSTNATAALADGTSKDPAHPHLYYHLTPPPPSAPDAVIISYLPTPPLPSSATYIGSLPAVPGAGLADFRENPKFRPLLHAAIREGIEQGKAEGVDYEAATRPGDGFMHLTDERNMPPPGRIGDAEDLIATIFVQDGKVVPSTYEPLPTYRLVTSEGVLTLPRDLDDYVVSVLEKVDREEKAKGE